VSNKRSKPCKEDFSDDDHLEEDPEELDSMALTQPEAGVDERHIRRLLSRARAMQDDVYRGAPINAGAVLALVEATSAVFKSRRANRRKK